MQLQEPATLFASEASLFYSCLVLELTLLNMLQVLAQSHLSCAMYLVFLSCKRAVVHTTQLYLDGSQLLVDSCCRSMLHIFLEIISIPSCLPER